MVLAQEKEKHLEGGIKDKRLEQEEEPHQDLKEGKHHITKEFVSLDFLTRGS